MALFHENVSSSSLVPLYNDGVLLVPRKPVGYNRISEFSDSCTEFDPDSRPPVSPAISTKTQSPKRQSTKKQLVIKRRPVGAGFPTWFQHRICMSTSTTFPECLAALSRIDTSSPSLNFKDPFDGVRRVPVPKYEGPDSTTDFKSP